MGEQGRERDLAEIRGKETAKRAREVALASGHHLLRVGPPGSGKTILAEARLRLATPCRAFVRGGWRGETLVRMRALILEADGTHACGICGRWSKC
jgi:SpoVK/Ycf46/Vps4 family AAA+-type ATPase